MIFTEKAVKLTPAELNSIRSAAAAHGYVHNRIETREALLQALLDGLATPTQDELLTFLEDADRLSRQS